MLVTAPTALGALLPLGAVGVGLLVPRTAMSEVAIPALFVVSGALIGRWWAPLPAVVVASALSLAELIGLSRAGTAIELHAGGFDVGFSFLSAAVVGALALGGAGLRRAGWMLAERIRQARG